MHSAHFDRPTPPIAPTAPGLLVDEEGNGTFAVLAPRATAVDLCVQRESGEERQRLRHFDAGLRWDEVRSMTPGTRYGLRAHGTWDPATGQYYNPHKLLLDPCGRGVSHASPLLSSMFPLRVDSMLRPVSAEASTVDSGPTTVWSEVVADRFDWQGDHPPRTDWASTSVYELHVKGYTRLHPDLPAELRGTYAGLAHPMITEHLRGLGISAVELLPIHAALDEPHLTRLGLTNYWGYSTLGYFAPNPAYATAAAQRAGAQAVLDEVKGMVRALHAAGLEVILDVVYNHTAEGGAGGPSVCLRGLDNQEYYWMSDGKYMDVTGTGATLDARSVHVQDLVLSSLRYWVEQVHVDGFRFDLAPAIARDDRGFRADHPLLRAMQTDPVLRRVKLIAEPWDLGGDGWQTGSFPHPFAEWNDGFRNDVRGFWLAQPAERARSGGEQLGGVRDIATRLTGSSDLMRGPSPDDFPFDYAQRNPWASVNFVTAHDGFTLADLTTYAEKHNEANGEGNSDGSTDNRSWNHGAEGPADLTTADGTALDDRRRRTARSILATLLLASGTPMITAGDERGRTQRGNNNAYCQDNEISWVDWEDDPRFEATEQTVRTLLALRREHPQLRTPHFLRFADPQSLDAGHVAWFDADGEPMSHEQWMDGSRHTLQMMRPGMPGRESLLIILTSWHEDVPVRLPRAPWPTGPARVLYSSASDPWRDVEELPSRLDARPWMLPASSVVVLALPPR